MTHWIKILGILTVIAMSACTDNFTSIEDMTQIKTYPNVDEELWPYFTRFEIAAADYGITINLQEARLSGRIQAIQESGSVGVCNFNNNQPSEIIIDHFYWKDASEMRRELITFHELGHCFLSRGHKDKANSNGICTSIMRNGRGGCLDFYNQNTRGELIKELFLGE